MKNAIFLVLIALSFQGIAQVKSGVYKSNETAHIEYNIHGEVIYEETIIEDTYIQVGDNGVRLFFEMPDYGVFYPWMHIRTEDDINYYTISEEDA